MVLLCPHVTARDLRLAHITAVPALARGTVATLALGRTHVTAATLAPCRTPVTVAARGPHDPLALLWPHLLHMPHSRYYGRT